MGIFNATITYGKTFMPTEKDNEYSNKIFTGGLAFRKTASMALKKEAEKFIRNSELVSYEIVESNFSFVPSGYNFTVKFSK